MRSAAYGLGWHVVQRHRLGLTLLALGMLGLVALRQVPGIAIGAVVGCSIWLMFGLLYVAAIFTQPEADITAPGSGYPNHLFILPVRTRELVLWPMLYGGVCISAGWLVLAGLVMNRPPAVAPLYWPACMMVAALTSLQALFWTPMRFPTVRVFIALGLLSGLIYLGAGNPFGWVEWKLSAVYGMIALAAYGLAVRGVACARMSAQAVRVPREAVSLTRVKKRTSFRSPQTAQCWYEWRRGGVILPIVTFVLCALFSIPLFFEHTLSAPPSDLPVSTNVYLGVYLGGLLRGVPFTAWILGGAVWISGARASALAIPAFIAMRPISSVQMAVARFKSRFKSAAIAFGLTLAVATAWLMLPGGLFDARTGEVVPMGPALGLVVHLTSLGDLGVALVYVLLLFAITARNYVVGQFASLSGKPVIAYAYMATVYAGPVLAMSMFAMSQGHGLTQTNLYEFFLVAIVAKCVAALIVLRGVLLRDLTSARYLSIFIVAWCLAVFAVYGAFSLVVQSHGPIPRLLGFTDLQSGFPPQMLWLMAILWTPLARLVAMPLMIENNRRGR